MKPFYKLLVCIIITFVNPMLYAMDDTSHNKKNSVRRALEKEEPYEHIKNMLERGANPNGVKGDVQDNPLVFLLDFFGERRKVHHDIAIAKLLLEHGADPNALPYIAVSAAKRNDEILDVFLANGMKLDVYDSEGSKGTPLTQAIAHLEGLPCLKRVLKLIKAGASVQDGCALLEAAAQGREEIVGVLFAHKCSPRALVRKYWSITGAMDCSREEGEACDLYLDFYKEFHQNSTPQKHKRINALFRKALLDPQSFVYRPDIMQLFDAAPQFPAIKTNTCVCRVIDPEDLQYPEDRKIMSELECSLQNMRKDGPLCEQHLISTVLPAMNNMKDAQARVCFTYHLLTKGYLSSSNSREQFHTLLCTQPQNAFIGHKSLKADRDTDMLVRIISKAYKKKSERGEYKTLFEKLFALRPQEWQPSWRHMNTALRLAQEDVRYYLEALLSCCNINAYGPNGQTPLHVLLTAEHVHAGIIEMLLDAGANPNLPDMSHGGNTALQLALNKKYWDFINEYNDGEGSSNENSEEESAYVSPKEIKGKVITLLVNHGADVKQPNLYGQTAEDSMREYSAKLEMHLLAAEVLSEVTQQLQLSENSVQEEH